MVYITKEITLGKNRIHTEEETYHYYQCDKTFTTKAHKAIIKFTLERDHINAANVTRPLHGKTRLYIKELTQGRGHINATNVTRLS